MKVATRVPPAVTSLRGVWVLNALIAVACVALLAGPLRGYSAIVPDILPWWAVAVGVAVTERWPVHLELRRSAHSFSLTDVPVTLGLLFLPGAVGVGAAALGGLVALLLRRMQPVKLAFNMAQFTCTTAVSYVVLHVISGANPEFGPRVWIAALIAMQVGGLITTALLGMAEGWLTRRELRQMVGLDAAVTATNTSLALVLGVIAVVEPKAAPILAIPIIIAFLAYRSYINERQQHEKLEFLYEANRGLAESRDEVAQALVGLLRRALEAYRSEQAEVLMFSVDEDKPPLRTSLASEDDEEHMVPADPGSARALRQTLAAHGRPMVLEEPFPEGTADYLAERGIRHAMIAELRGEQRQVGLIILANRTGFARRFSDDDLALFDTLADNASTALQYDRLEQAVSELSDLQERLRHQAFHDPLTGLANRALFHVRVEEALTAGRNAAVLFIDLDDFKAVNDTLGHAVGDRLLRAAARRLTGCVRGNDLVARLGGDEFAVLCVDDGDAEEVGIGVAERLLEAFQMPLAVATHVLPVALSLGIATNRHSGNSVDPLLRDADMAMYQAKEAGKGRLAVYDPAMREILVGRLGLRAELERAIDDDALSVHFQPIFDMATGDAVAAEALVRWRHPTRGMLAPAEFIPLAEETGLIVPLGRRILEAACREGRGWSDAGAPIDVHVNLSAREMEDDSLIATVTAVLAETGLDPARLVLEITETVLVHDAQRGAETLNGLRTLGVRLALDDFGTGYSSLSYLRTLPLDVIKVAREFVVGIAESPADAAFVRLIIDLAGTVGLTVVAEGIETTEQLRVLRALGCDQGQGFLYARPLSARAWHAADLRRMQTESFSDL